MKNGKRPTVAQRRLIGADSDNWLVVKDTTETLTLISRDGRRLKEIHKVPAKKHHIMEDMS